jgi:hypothetical protein
MTPADKHKARELVAGSMVLARDIEPLVDGIASALADERESAAVRVERSPRRLFNREAPAYVSSVTREDCARAARAKP